MVRGPGGAESKNRQINIFKRTSRAPIDCRESFLFANKVIWFRKGSPLVVECDILLNEISPYKYTSIEQYFARHDMICYMICPKTLLLLSLDKNVAEINISLLIESYEYALT